MGQKKYARGLTVACHESELEKPLRWQKPRYVFVCSMSDLFHEDVPDPFLQKVFRTMDLGGPLGHTFFVLTKRAKRMAAFRYEETSDGRWPHNVWAGITAENQETYDDRVRSLVKTPAVIRWASLEPLLGPISLRATGRLHPSWVVVGGETGPGARPMDLDWARALRDECAESGIPFFFKQLGGRTKKGGRLLDGKIWNERPGVLGSGHG
jgi:protein gp37